MTADAQAEPVFGRAPGSGRLDRRTFRHLITDTVPPISNRSIMTDISRIPDKPALEGLESVWGDTWEREGENKDYFNLFSPRGYAIGVNTVVYALTH